MKFSVQQVDYAFSFPANRETLTKLGVELGREVGFIGTKRMSHGLFAYAAYTFSKTISNVDNVTNGGGCDSGYSCAYQTTLAWASPTTPLPTQSSPRLVFEQLFGDGGSASQQLAALTPTATLIERWKDPADQPAARAAIDDFLR